MESTNKAINKIVLDTNMLLSALEFKVDLFSEINALLPGRKVFFVPGQVMQELNALGRHKKLALRVNIIKDLLENNKVRLLEIKALNADAALLKAAEQNYFVATNDKELKKRVKQVNGSVLFLRKKKFVELD